MRSHAGGLPATSTNQTEDFALYSPSRFGKLGRPLYKPEHWDKVIELDMWTNKYDPVMTCQPLGLPRQGPPRRIFQTENDITFLYGQFPDAGGGFPEFRVIPIDGRQHGPDARYATKYFGDTVGRWEGDTLVLDSIGFIDTTWIGRGGYFHSDKMHIVERLKREGDAIIYDLTLEDPEVLVEPLVFPTRIMRRNAGGDAGLILGTWQLRDGLRNRSGRLTDSALRMSAVRRLDGFRRWRCTT